MMDLYVLAVGVASAEAVVVATTIFAVVIAATVDRTIHIDNED